MAVKEKIYETIEEYDGSGNIDECVTTIKKFMYLSDSVLEFEIHTDTDVFDSCGLGIYYISVAWNDDDGVLNVCGSRLTSK